jgi:hypothetical protein
MTVSTAAFTGKVAFVTGAGFVVGVALPVDGGYVARWSPPMKES